ncbi:MAG: ABC transporter permease [Pirellulales bacterium]
MTDRAAACSPASALADWWAGTRRIGLWGTLAWYDTVLRYRRSLLGPLWITVSTGVLLLGMGPVYSGLFNVPLNRFYPHLAAGIILWHFFVSSITEGCQVFITAAPWLKQAEFPLAVFVWRSLAKQLILLAHQAVLFVPIAAWAGVGWSPRQLLAIPGLLVVLVNLHALAIILGILTARFRDIAPIVSSGLQLAMFLTPVFWMPDRLPARARFVLLNPLAQMLDVVRLPLINALPAPGTWWFLLGWTSLTVAVAAALYAACRRRVVYWI